MAALCEFSKVPLTREGGVCCSSVDRKGLSVDGEEMVRSEMGNDLGWNCSLALRHLQDIAKFTLRSALVKSSCELLRACHVGAGSKAVKTHK